MYCFVKIENLITSCNEVESHTEMIRDFNGDGDCGDGDCGDMIGVHQRFVQDCTNSS